MSLIQHLMDSSIRESAPAAGFPRREDIPTTNVSPLNPDLWADEPCASLNANTIAVAHSAPHLPDAANVHKTLIYARIIDATPETVTLECLMDDVEPSYLEERTFHRELFGRVGTLELYKPILITILKGEDFITHKVALGTGIVPPDAFDFGDPFQELEDLPPMQTGFIS